MVASGAGDPTGLAQSRNMQEPRRFGLCHERPLAAGELADRIDLCTAKSGAV